MTSRSETGRPGASNDRSGAGVRMSERTMHHLNSISSSSCSSSAAALSSSPLALSRSAVAAAAARLHFPHRVPPSMNHRDAAGGPSGQRPQQRTFAREGGARDDYSGRSLDEASLLPCSSGEAEFYKRRRAASEFENEAPAQRYAGDGAVKEREPDGGDSDRWRPRGAGTGRWPDGGGADRWRPQTTGDGRWTGGAGTEGERRRDGYNWRERTGGGMLRRPGRVFESPKANHRHWCAAQTEVPVACEKFVILSYNILADKNAAQHYSQLYHHIPLWMMDWDRRKEKLARELGRWSPDIMCLQEVDKYEDLEEIFHRRGYLGVYKGRTGGALDGCAMFWKTSRFQLLQEESIQFNELGLRDNVAQLCVFQSVRNRQTSGLSAAGFSKSETRQRPGGVIVVGNIHVLFNPKRGDVKLGQVRVLLESAHALSDQWGGAHVTIAGDFNSTPKSDLYKFLSTSELDISCLNRTTMSGQAEGGENGHMPWLSQTALDLSCGSVETESPNAVAKKWHWTQEELMAATGRLDCSNLRHKFNLRSAYTQIRGELDCRDNQGEPLVTTFHRKFMGTVDYICSHVAFRQRRGAVIIWQLLVSLLFFLLLSQVSNGSQCVKKLSRQVASITHWHHHVSSSSIFCIKGVVQDWIFRKSKDFRLVSLFRESMLSLSNFLLLSAIAGCVRTHETMNLDLHDRCFVTLLITDMVYRKCEVFLISTLIFCCCSERLSEYYSRTHLSNCRSSW